VRPVLENLFQKKGRKMKNIYKTAIVAIGSLAVSFISAKAQIIITEVDAAGSGTSTYGVDWFELTNEGSSSVSISNWKMDDNSDSFADAVAINGVSSIAAGQSVVFLEDDSLPAGENDATITTAFQQAWFGSNVPTGLTIGYYGGKGVGLSQGGDQVNIFDSSGTQITGVNFGASDPNGATFDNSALKLGGTLKNDSTISTLSVAGVHGAFDSATGGEIGSPGAVPEPGTYVMVLGGLGLLAFVLRRRVIAGI
jgi:hypothetical protein